MKRQAILTASAMTLALAACAPAALRPAGGGWGDAPAVSADDYALRDPAAFGLSGQESLAEATAIIQASLSSSEPVEGDYREAISVYSAEIIGQDRGAVVFTRSNLPDDSVEADQSVIEFAIDGETGAASASAFGTRQKCRRGANPGIWTNQPCP